MIEPYVRELSAALAAVGIRGRLRQRILLETEDHLRSDPEGVARFGSAVIVAQRFADELSTAKTRAAAYAAFAALATAGAGVTAALVLANKANDLFVGDGIELAVALAAAWFIVLAPQLAFVAGSLALVRALRRRDADVVPANEVHLLRRRTLIAVGSGWVTILALAVYAALKGGPEPVWWTPVVLGVCGAAALALAWATARLLVAARLRPVAQGPAGDALEDLEAVLRFVPVLGRLRLSRHPLLVCVVFAGTALLAVFLPDALAGRPIWGAMNVIFEAVALSAGMWLFGDSLGLRPDRRTRDDARCQPD